MDSVYKEGKVRNKFLLHKNQLNNSFSKKKKKHSIIWSYVTWREVCNPVFHRWHWQLVQLFCRDVSQNVSKVLTIFTLTNIKILFPEIYPKETIIILSSNVNAYILKYKYLSCYIRVLFIFVVILKRAWLTNNKRKVKKLWKI